MAKVVYVNIAKVKKERKISNQGGKERSSSNILTYQHQIQNEV